MEKERRQAGVKNPSRGQIKYCSKSKQLYFNKKQNNCTGMNMQGTPDHNKYIINSSKSSPEKAQKFPDALFEFIRLVESEIDIMLTGSASLRLLSRNKLIDQIISQKLSKNIIIKMLCPLDEDGTRLMKQLAPFVGFKSIKLSLSKSTASSSSFIRDNQDIFSFSIDMQK
jgi:hypothetical protein